MYWDISKMGGSDRFSRISKITVCRTDVRLLEAGQKPRLLEYRQGQRQPVLIAEGDTGKIRQDFLERTREIRENNNSDNTGKIYFILNKVDRKAEKDREIADVFEDLKETLI